MTLCYKYKDRRYVVYLEYHPENIYQFAHWYIIDEGCSNRTNVVDVICITSNFSKLRIWIPTIRCLFFFDSLSSTLIVYNRDTDTCLIFVFFPQYFPDQNYNDVLVLNVSGLRRVFKYLRAMVCFVLQIPSTSKL